MLVFSLRLQNRDQTTFEFMLYSNYLTFVLL